MLFDENYAIVDVGSESGNNIIFIKSVLGCSFGSHAISIAETAFISLSPGKYYLSTKVKFRDTTKPNTYTLSTYAKNDITLSEITTPNFYQTLFAKGIVQTYKNKDTC